MSNRLPAVFGYSTLTLITRPSPQTPPKIGFETLLAMTLMHPTLGRPSHCPPNE
jgi:hypothetical protein